MPTLYRAAVDGRPIGGWYDNFTDAARHLVNSGLAVWHGECIKHLPESGSEIERRHVENWKS